MAVSKKTVSSIISSESNSHPLRVYEKFSEFGDSVCGEPLCAQRLMIDFTPVEDLDNDFVQKKCCAFWELISSRPELKNLMAMPEPSDMKVYDWTSSNESDSSSGSVKLDSNRPVKEKTAVSMLEIIEDEGLIDRTFEAKLPQSQCRFGSKEYLQDGTTEAAKIKPDCSCKGVCESSKKRESEDECLPHSIPEVINMCKILKEWDKKHPKSMEPPSHSPSIEQ